MSRIIKASTFQLQKSKPPEEPTVENKQKKAILEASQITADAQLRALAIVEEAKSQGQNILDDAKEKEEQQQQQGHAQGHKQGYEEGKAQFWQEFGQKLQLLDQVLHEANTIRYKAIEMAEEDLVKLSLAIAEKIIRQEIKNKQNIVKGIVAEALTALSGAEKIFIRVNQADMAFLEEETEELKQLAIDCNIFTFIADQKISPGGCLIDTDIGKIDAQLETRLSRLRKELVDVIDS